MISALIGALSIIVVGAICFWVIDAKREVIIYDYVDMSVPVLARMAAKRRVGYQTIGYRILGTGDLFSDQSVASEAVGEAPATFSV
jgi:hypothetical protein